MFNKNYFHTLYAKDETIDGDFNAKEHAKYLKALFELMGYHPHSIFDYGFGKGTLLREISKALECSKISGTDISTYAYKRIRNKIWAKNWHLLNKQILDLKVPKKPYSIGICNSVLQYKNPEEVEKTLKLMARSCKFVYLHVPTKEDYEILMKDLNFTDPYANKYSNIFFRKKISKYFTFVSWGLVESKSFSSHKNSLFTDSIYRF